MSTTPEMIKADYRVLWNHFQDRRLIERAHLTAGCDGVALPYKTCNRRDVAGILSTTIRKDLTNQ